MDWSKTKTIFIAVFLVLDIFLAVMFFNKYSTSRFEVIKKTSIEQKLQEDGVKHEEMPDDSGERSMIVAKPKTFTEKELFFLTKQKWAIEKSGTEIVSLLEEPYKTDGAARSKLNAFVKNNVLHGGEYAYWKRNQEANTVIYYQKIAGKKLFENAAGMLTVQLNNDKDIVSYSQTMLSSVDENRNKETILPALQAIDSLYKNGLVQLDSEISDAELGYYTVVRVDESQQMQLDESKVQQVLSPTWYFQLKKGDKIEEVYVNAFDGSINPQQKES
ncbi:two-component system regulatory protein YycI [Domibacillus sp. PGB-M46]|uniref:two-component system regulatory protein YycI n=1 Tax=Domibacillus sp. PGB-M46 TaxID=2910255 RepID=UPI001F5A3C11|nr:two-component system regulatory protein YycI [Domibacillus sp. PGB-M46]MCI2253583.1 two-component system regulatory protein YycI [Domibacillus sp. PGB-M46]